ncbi:MAG: 8-oxo-dGTP diphosphatase [Eubacterium sp.]|nr:8-oxo-dGTP diphosphatase [Eubacterium sp.]
MKTPELTTLCYIERDNKYLMLHRIKKQNDINKDKYIGVGGHFEYGESPDECLLREVKEETGLILLSYRPRGIVTFIYGDPNTPEERVVEYMHLYTADRFESSSGRVDEDELSNREDGTLSDVGEEKPANDDVVDDYRLPECDEGELIWIDKDKVYDLPVWEGDKIFFRLLEEREDYFSLKLVYDEDGKLLESVIN